MIYSIQILRYISAIFVLYLHVAIEANAEHKFGNFGVDIFFVISGFIINYVTEKNQSCFIRNRAIRIAPLYWSATFGISFLLLSFPQLFKSTSFDITHLLFSILFLPYWTEENAFQPLLMLGWTLNMEIFFYLTFYISMKISHRRRAPITIFFISIIWLLANSFGTHDMFYKFYANNIVFEFCFGLLLSEILFRKKLYILPSVSLALIACSTILLIILDINNMIFGLRSITFGLPSTVLVLAVLSLERYIVNYPNVMKDFISLLGDISYPLYLFHVYIIFSISRIIQTEIDAITLFLFSVGISSASSVVVLKFFDLPLRRYLKGL